jgi:divalent metal cation (Fe/Co/Zn/Cd) transporter
LNIAGVNVDIIRDAVSTLIGEYISSEVEKRIEQNNSKFKAGP